MKWRDVKPGDQVYWRRRPAIVLTANHVEHNVLNVADERPHVEVAFSLPNPRDYYGPECYYDKDLKEHRFYDGLYCLLASKTVTPVQ